LLHKGSAEEWNSVMINEHLPGKPLQHNLFSVFTVYIREECMTVTKGGGGNDNTSSGCIRLNNYHFFVTTHHSRPTHRPSYTYTISDPLNKPFTTR
jgi:hypothetical protein